MCGIAGLFSTDRRADVRPALERLTAALSHRGPDGWGYQYFDGVSGGFGHRRLSIVDVQGGGQPMANEDETVWVVFNGEIYNHLTLRAELERLGHVFRTRADTEVLVHGWEEWGLDLFGRLNGMFAFALYDQRHGGESVLLVRDPVGVKPLYLGESNSSWWFASELHAARIAGLVPGDLRRDTLAHYLTYRFIPSPGTPFRRVWKVPPGHYCRVTIREGLGEPSFEAYKPRFAPSHVAETSHEWCAALRAGLQDAVTRQLMSDVPVGVLLSGGVDSTLITMMMRAGGADGVEAFAVGLLGESQPDELSEARAVAGALSVPLVETGTTEAAMLEAWPRQIAMLGEPIANPGVVLIGLLCQTVSSYRKVVLTGQGADEPLGGYPRHVAERFYPWLRLLRPLLARVPPWLAGNDQVLRAQRMVSRPCEADRFAELLAVFSPEAAGQLLGGIDPREIVAPVVRRLDALPDSDSLNRLLALDATFSLSDDLLIVADHASMAASVELRVPFLDLEFLALTQRMPSRFKISAIGERKWLYRRAVRGMLPATVGRRLTGARARLGRKWGFSTGLADWCRQWTARGARSYLLGAQNRITSFLAPEGVAAQVARAERDPDRSQRQMLSLYVLETWLRSNTS